jgi:hypothetical protein
VRQAHRAVLGGGLRVGPGWVVGGLLAFTFLSTGMAAGSTPAGAVAGARSSGPAVARLSLSVAGDPAAGKPVAVPDPAGAASSDISRAGSISDVRVAGPVLALLETDEAGLAPDFPAPHAAATPRAAATVVAKERPKPRPTSTPVKKSTAQATTAKSPKPTPKPTPKPAPAIVYRHKAVGRATWGEFGGAVITRLSPGTRIRVCGRLGCWAGVSSGFGPSPDGGNLVDLDASIFRRIYGPLGTGVGSIVLSWR